MAENCSEWIELGPPPDMILTLPPPPLPSFLQVTTTNTSSHSCLSQCDWSSPNNNGVQFVELTSHGADHELDDTWFFVLIFCSIGVLLLGSLLALLLLKCREDGYGYVRRERDSKTVPVRLETPVDAKKACEAVIYPGDNRVLWATLTPRGTTTQAVTTHNLSAFDNTGFSETDYRPRTAGTAVEPVLRGIVSSPTRIENPNMPPLNLPSHRKIRQQPPLL